MAGEDDVGRCLTPLERLDERVDRSAGPDACWPWRGARNEHGYGVLRVGDRNVRTHRLALVRDGEDPGSAVKALHSCDNPPCCNPAHLRWGTQRDNMNDAIARGRRVYPKKAVTSAVDAKPPAGRFTNSTTCVHGHPFDDDNTILKPNKKVKAGYERVCRTCRTARHQRQSARRKAARAAGKS